MLTRRPRTRITLAALALPVLLATVPRPASAQDQRRLQLLGGIMALETSDIVEDASTGWVAGGVWTLAGTLGLELQVSRLERTEPVTFLDVNARFLTLLVGPTITWRLGPMHPFGHILVGTTQLDLTVMSDVPFRSSGTSQETDATLDLGGGADVPLTRRLSVRVAYDSRRVFAVERFYQHGVSAYAIVGFGGSL